MSGSDHTHSFAAPLFKLEKGFARHHYVPIPMEIADELRDAGIRRVIVELNGREYRRAIMGRKDGERYVVVSKEMMREMGVGFGDTVLVDLRPDPDPDRVELCEELVGVLKQDEAAAERFYGMTPGRQRSFNLHVSSSKRSETRIKCALDVAYKLRTYTLYDDRKTK